MHTYGFRGASLLGAACMLTLVSGCAQMGGMGMPGDAGSQARSGAAEEAPHECNPALGGALGALAGSMFGKG
jgi:hypothetical protein